MLHKELADYYSRVFDVKVTASFVKRNFDALEGAGWYNPGMDIASPQTVIGSVRDDFIMFCSKHTIPNKSKPKPKPKSQDSELRIALWFIREIGDIERAKKVFNAACLASEALK